MDQQNTKLVVADPALSEPQFRLVDDTVALGDVVQGLLGAETLYLDTEFASRREGTELGLIQVSRGGQVFLVDAVRLRDLTPLAPVFDAEGTTWVLHAGLQDVALLTERLGLSSPRRVFDTQVAWSLVTVEYSVSLAYLKYRLLGIRGEKAHQADDWIRRPLPRTQLAYAAEDVLHLPQIYGALLERCAALGRTGAVFDATLETLSSSAEPDARVSLDSFRNAWQLAPDGQAVLRFLIGWYNGLTTADRSRAPDSKGLLAIASRRPRSLEELGSLRAVPRRCVELHGRTLLAGIQQAIHTAASTDFVSIAPAPYGTPEEILAHGWMEAIRADLSVALGIAPELAFPARLTRRMRETAVSAGRLDAAGSQLTGWREEILANEFRARATARFGTFSAGLAPKGEFGR